MSLETLLTVAVAGVLLTVLMILRLFLGLVRWLAGGSERRARKPIADAVAGPSWFERVGRGASRLRPIWDGVLALFAIVAANVATWWQKAARPALADAREAGIARLTEHPETLGELDLLVRESPVMTENGSAAEREAKEPHLV